MKIVMQLLEHHRYKYIHTKKVITDYDEMMLCTFKLAMSSKKHMTFMYVYFGFVCKNGV